MKWVKDNCNVGCIYKSECKIGGVQIQLMIDCEDVYVAYVYIGSFKWMKAYKHLRSAKRGCDRAIRKYIAEAQTIIEACREYILANAER